MVIDIPRMIDYIKKHKNVFLFSGSLLLAAVLIAVLVIFSGPAKKASNTSLPASNINPAANEIAYSTLDEAHTAYEEPRESTVNNAATERDRATEGATEALTTAPATTQAAQQGDVVFATAEVPDSPADYQAQWDAGYLLAIDNPDTSYSTYHIDLTDSDRQLLENLCYGEFGTGGFIGAALIAQAVKERNAVRRCATSLTTTAARFSTEFSTCTRRISSTAPSMRVRTSSSAISRSVSLTAGAHNSTHNEKGRHHAGLFVSLISSSIFVWEIKTSY